MHFAHHTFHYNTEVLNRTKFSNNKINIHPRPTLKSNSNGHVHTAAKTLSTAKTHATDHRTNTATLTFVPLSIYVQHLCNFPLSIAQPTAFPISRFASQIQSSVSTICYMSITRHAASALRQTTNKLKSFSNGYKSTTECARRNGNRVRKPNWETISVESLNVSSCVCMRKFAIFDNHIRCDELLYFLNQTQRPNCAN